MYKCKQCGIEQETSMFYKHPKTKDGIIHRCKSCIIKGRHSGRELLLARESYRKRFLSSPKFRLYKIWKSILIRCYDNTDSNYKWYGGKGIKVLWKNFKEFKADMQESYSKHRELHGKLNKFQTQIDRIDNDGHYCKENCRWCTAKENNKYNK